MPLSALAVMRAKPGPKPYKLTDGHGMYLLMTPAGGRYWRLNYRFDGKARTMALGVFPDVTLADVRSKRDDARKILAEGEDPTAKRKERTAQAKFDATTSFRWVAEEWLAKREREGLGDVTIEGKMAPGVCFPSAGRSQDQRNHDAGAARGTS